MLRRAVLICDDHPLVSHGLKGLLKPSFYTVGVVNDSRMLLDAIERAKPEILLLDLSMPHINGLELLPKIRESAPALKVVVVTMHIDRALADLAISAGAHGFIPKEASAEELNDALEHVLTNPRPFISPRVPRRAYREASATQHPALERLTPRQKRILELLADGKSTQETADLLSVSPRTVEFHRASIRKALGITTESGLMRFAIMLAMAESQEPPPEDVSQSGESTDSVS